MDGTTQGRSGAADLTRVLAGRAAALGWDDLPAAVRELAQQCVLDYLGVAIAGAGDPLVGLLLDEMIEAGGAASGNHRQRPTIAGAGGGARQWCSRACA